MSSAELFCKVHKLTNTSEARHACDQGDNLDTYTWTEYDAREGGVQVIKDSANNVQLTTEFLKVPGGQHGGSWAARIRGEPIDPSTSLRDICRTHGAHYVPSRVDRVSRISTIFYMGLEGVGGLEMETDEDENVSSLLILDTGTDGRDQGLEGTVVFAGSSVELDEFTIRVVDGMINILRILTSKSLSLVPQVLTTGA